MRTLTCPYRVFTALLAACAALVSSGMPLYGQGLVLSVQTDDAKRTLDALQNSSVTYEQALTIANLHASQGVIQKDREFGFESTTESFAKALYAAAHGEPVSDPVEQSHLFDRVKPKTAQLRQLLAAIDTNSSLGVSAARVVQPFVPKGANIHSETYIVVAGDGGGYVFDNTDVFVNISYEDDVPTFTQTMTHEFYHAIQNALRSTTTSSTKIALPSKESACAHLHDIFEDLYNEGSAMYVDGRAELLPQSHSIVAQRQAADMEEGLRRIQDAVTLLDLSILGISAPKPVPYDDIYGLDFFGHGTLYNLGYVIARSIVEQDGPEGLAAFLRRPPYEFVLRYTQLKKYGVDKDHPRLGPNTFAAANQLLSGCHQN